MKPSHVSAFCVAVFVIASGCSSDDGSSPAGTSGSGGSGRAGSDASGGSVAKGGSDPKGTGGGDSGGSAGRGGSAATGGTSNGGTSNGGTSNGGTSNGGTSNGGSGGEITDSACGPLSGNFECDEGIVHRPAPGTCEINLPPDVGPSSSDVDECTKNSDCTEKPNGVCSFSSGLRGGWNRCGYLCTTDADCDAEEICRCGKHGGYCARASCKSDAECSGHYCAEYSSRLPYVKAFACQTEKDECATDEDCKSTPRKPYCAFELTHRICMEPFALTDAPN